MKKFILDLTVSSISQPHERYVLIKLTHDRPLPDMLPGQFAEVRVDHSPATFLRRPISVCNVDRAANELWLLVALVGEGTRQLARLKKQERLNCVLPLGNGFSTNDTLYNNKAEAAKTLLVGGGVGVAPLLYLGAELKKNGGEPTFLLGARTAKANSKSTETYSPPPRTARKAKKDSSHSTQYCKSRSSTKSTPADQRP